MTNATNHKATQSTQIADFLAIKATKTQIKTPKNTSPKQNPS